MPSFQALNLLLAVIGQLPELVDSVAHLRQRILLIGANRIQSRHDIGEGLLERIDRNIGFERLLLDFGPLVFQYARRARNQVVRRLI